MEMDPQSVAFTPNTDSWRVPNELLRLQQVQADHSDRLLRLERRQEEDARMKSVWGGTSPFPSVLSGTPQQAPLQQPPSDHFKDFDDESSALIGSLHLDAEEEPRRMGASSRANSVRFDESANQGHWGHASRTSLDYMPRSSSGLGGLAMSERTPSHRSEGRASSVHSVRSAASARANSLNLDAGFGLDSSRTLLDAPGFAPGLLLLGPVPAIIRCWMNTNFKHDALLYAAVCTGSHKSFLDMILIQQLGVEHRIVEDASGRDTIELPVYFPEAVPHPAYSRSSSPAPQIPTLTVVFIVRRSASETEQNKRIKILLGSDMLRAHNADILFSSNSMSLFDDERNKLSIPLVRPEHEEAFNTLQTTTGQIQCSHVEGFQEDVVLNQAPPLNGLGQHIDDVPEVVSSPQDERYRTPGALVVGSEGTGAGASETEGSVASRPGSRDASSAGQSLSQINTQAAAKATLIDDYQSRDTPVRPGSSPAIWSNWRRESNATTQSSQFDWTNNAKTKEAGYQRRETGIKVLKPTKSATRTFSTSSAVSPLPSDGRSRFFDEGKRRIEAEATQDDQKVDTSAQIAEAKNAVLRENASAASAPKTRTNPAGGASAFAWLNHGGTNVVSRAATPRQHVSTTASSKKRKTAADTKDLEANNEGRPLFAPEVDHPDRQPSPSPALSSPRPLPSLDGRSNTPSSPLRYIPPHLQAATADLSGPRGGTSTGASSPSEAYAALNLGPSVAGETMSESQDGDTIVLAATASPARGEGEGEGDSGRSEVRAAHQGLARRSASPAKRSAEHLDDLESPARGGPTTVASSATDTAMADTITMEEPVQGGAGNDKNDLPPPYSAQDPVPSPAIPIRTYTTAEIDAQVQQIRDLSMSTLEDGERACLISAKWLNRVLARSSAAKSSEQELEGHIGPVDNQAIVPPGAFQEPLLHFGNGNVLFVPINPGLERKDDYEAIPQEAWDSIVNWYGLADGQVPIVRFATNTAPEEAASSNIQYEINPPVFLIRKILGEPGRQATPPTPPGTTATSQVTTGNNTPVEGVAVQMVASRTERFQTFLTRSKKAAGIPMAHKVRIWRQLNAANITLDKPSHPKPTDLTPAASRSASPTHLPLPIPIREKLVVQPAVFKKMEEGLHYESVDAKDETANDKYNGSVTLETIGLYSDQTLILEEQVRGPAGGEFVSDAQRRAVKNGLKPKVENTTGRASPAPAGPTTRGRARRDGRARGAIGLTNLGNTCYMNSALQCISRVEELALYFLELKFKREINSDNPLGYHGKIANAFHSLLEGLYSSSSSSAYTPRPFKGTLAQAQPMFSGYGQQDSQEFLSFLVDALHEDLNRIHKKPYIENPDSDDKTVHDPEAIRQLGETYRANHRARNDSIAMDLFNGFYKNTMVCPDCDKVSVTFDPYSLLTLQLPIENTWQHTLLFLPQHGRPTLHRIDVEKNTSVRALKEVFAKKVEGVTSDRLLFAETFSHKIYKVFKDNEIISECNILPNDILCMHEMPQAPTNISTSTKKSAYRSYAHSADEDAIPDMDSALADRMAVPVVHCKRRNAYTSLNLDYSPTFIMVTRDEAKDYNTILRKVLAAIVPLTSRDFLKENAKNPMAAVRARRISDSGSTGSDTAVNVDGRVSDRSVPSEDGYIDVSLQGGAAAEPSNGQDVDEVLQPGSFIPPALRSLFELRYYKSSNGDLHCAGNGQVGDAPSMTGRVQQRPARSESVSSLRSATSRRSQVSQSSRSTVSDEDADSPDLSLGGPGNRFHDEVQSDEEVLPTFDNVMQSNPKEARRRGFEKNHRRPKNQKTYSRKQARQNAKQSSRFNDSRASPQSESDADDDPYYIKLGEGIMLDWNDEAWDALFEGDASVEGDLRGYRTLDPQNMDTAPDPQLDAKQHKRSRRKNQGISLEDCFAETAKTETLSQENAWYCNRCKELRRADKTLEIWTVPDILVVHLKRFSGERYRRDKVDVIVDFPLEGLDLSDRIGMKEEGKECIYDLFAVDNHFGGLGGGHYTAYAKNFFDGKWYDFNDSSVGQKNEAGLITAAAYLLFYRRRSDRPLGPKYLQDLVNNARNPTADASAAASDEDELAGEDRLGDPHFSSRLLGSSSAGTTAGAAAGPLRGAHGGPAASRQARPRMTIEDDEGIGMGVEDDAYDDAKSPIGRLDGKVLQGPPRPGGDWDFAMLEDEQQQQHPEQQDVDGAMSISSGRTRGGTPAPSDLGAAGSDDGEDPQSRMYHDFPESLEGPWARNSPQEALYEDDLYNYHGDQQQQQQEQQQPLGHVVEVEDTGAGDEDAVHEIKVDDE